MADTIKQTVEQNSYDEITISQILHIVTARFWIVVLCVILAVGGAWFYLQRTVPVYEASGTALVSPITNSSSLDSLLGSTTNSSKISTEVSLITSEKNLDSALALLNLHDYTNSLGLHYDELEKPITGASLAGSKKISVTTVKDTNVVQVTVKDSSPEFCRDFVNAIIQAYSGVLTTIAKNSKTAQREFLEQQIPLNEKNLVDATEALAAFKQESGILQITEKNSILSTNVSRLQLQEEPLLHQQVEQQSLYEGYFSSLSSMGFKVSSINTLKADVKISENLDKIYGWYQEILMYQALGLSEDSASSSSRLYVLSSSISNSQKEVLSRVGEILKAEIVSNDALTIQMRNLYSQVVVQLLIIEQNINAIKKTQDYYMAELSQFPDLERRGEELQRSISVYQALSVTLRQMYEETKLLEAAISGYVTLIDVGTLPEKPVSPEKLKILAIAVLLGGILGVLIEWYLDFKDIRIHGSTMVKQMLGPNIPELGWIPLLNHKYYDKSNPVRLVSLLYPDSFAAERTSLIASNTIYSTDSTQVKVIGINSASKGEGKTMVVCNLAVSYAQMGKKVLLIDGDLRRPMIDTAFGLKKASKGICDMVVSRAPLSEVLIRPVKELDNLHLLCAGHVTKNPSMVFNSKVFDNFIKAARAHYDVILVDSPPASVAPEFAALIRHIDGVILNIRAGITTKPDLSELIENLGLIGTKMIGFVYSGVIVNDKRSSYYNAGKYGYGSSYSYDKKSYGDKLNEIDEKIIVKARNKNRTYKNYFNRELKERDKLDTSNFNEPVYIKDLGFAVDGSEPEAKAVLDPLSEIEMDSRAIGKK